MHFQETEAGLRLSHPYLWPLYERAQALDLVIAVHVGADSRILQTHWGADSMWHVMAQVPHACFSVITADLDKRFPALRWAFVEAGMSWLPFTLQTAARTDEVGRRVYGSDWRERAARMPSRW